jgi:cytochrome c biogenesis protein CcdA
MRWPATSSPPSARSTTRRPVAVLHPRTCSVASGEHRFGGDRARCGREWGQPFRHATDADHVVAVSTMVAQRQNTRAALRLGALWGLGHGLTILLVGGAIILLGVVVPPRVGLLLELGVAVMLITLGGLNLRTARTASNAAHPDHDHMQPARRFRSFVIGVVHGLAGSAAVALLVLSTLRDPVWAFLYLGLFGVGTVAGMMILTTAMSFPIAAAARRFGHMERWLGSLTGALSVAFGIFLFYQIGFVDGLFAADPSWSPR